jgi:CTP:molybdopterin cytidylyltransferase MocA
VLAVDMPRVTARTFRRLREATAGPDAGHGAGRDWGHDGAFLSDPTGRRQLCGVLTTQALTRVRPDLEGQHGMSMRSLLADLDLAEVPAIGEEARDIDTWADLRDLDA